MAISLGKHGFSSPKQGMEFGSDGFIPLPGFVIEITGTEQEIISRTGDPIGTIAFATDTNDIMVLNTNGFDRWASVEDTP